MFRLFSKHSSAPILPFLSPLITSSLFFPNNALSQKTFFLIIVISVEKEYVFSQIVLLSGSGIRWKAYKMLFATFQQALKIMYFLKMENQIPQTYLLCIIDHWLWFSSPDNKENAAPSFRKISVFYIKVWVAKLS